MEKTEKGSYHRRAKGESPGEAAGMKFSQSHFTSHSKHITLEKGKLIKPLHLNTFLCVYGRQRGAAPARASVIDSQFRLTPPLSASLLSFSPHLFCLFPPSRFLLSFPTSLPQTLLHTTLLLRRPPAAGEPMPPELSRKKNYLGREKTVYSRLPTAANCFTEDR